MAAPARRPDLRALPPSELAAFLASLGEKPYRARQLFRWIHQRGAASFEEMTDLPRALRQRLAQEAGLTVLETAAEQRSADGTVKWKWRTGDGLFVESVYMPEPGRRTLCISSQVGCALGCTFCLTATMGLARHLSVGEIVDQVARANRRLVELGEGPPPRPLTNLVFMGMGEPLHNYENVKAAIGLLLAEDGPQFSHRRVTVSTAGLVPAIRRLGEETEVKLAVSLNATTDEQRDALMPVNRRWPLATLLEACRSFPMRRGRRITFEYVLLRDVNDSAQDAARLALLLRGVPAKVNLIPYNESPGLPFSSPAPARVEAFRDALLARNVTVVVRRNRGRDISAACGQLAVREPAAGPRAAAASD